MGKGLRRLIFYLFLAIFLLFGSGVVVFALGYKYDFNNNRLVKTGSLQVKTNVSAEVFINEELAGKTSLITKSFSETFLLPKTYSVSVQRAEYQPWQKNIEVSVGQVIEFPVIYLLPVKPVSQVIASVSFENNFSVKFDPVSGLAIASSSGEIETVNLENGEVASSTLIPIKSSPKTTGLETSSAQKEIKSPDSNKALWFTSHEIWIRWLNNSNHQPFKQKGETELITRFARTINDVQWYEDSEHLIANVGGTLKFLETDTRGGVNTFNIAVITSASPFYYDLKTNGIYYFDRNKLYKISI